MIRLEELDAAVSAALAERTEKRIAAYEGPTSEIGETLTELFPFAFLEPEPGMVVTLAMSRAYSLVEVAYTLISCGKVPEQARWMADRLRDELVRPGFAPIEVANWKVIQADSDGGPTRPEPHAGKFWSIRESFILRVSRS